MEKKAAALASVTNAEELRKALRDRNNYYVSKAAARVAELAMSELAPDLVAAFERFMIDPAKADKQCWAKTAIAKALKEFGYDDADFFVRGMKHVQMEPVWGGSADTAQDLRCTSALGLVQCSVPRSIALRHLVDALTDEEKIVRGNAARAMAQLGGMESVLLLRLKALIGDGEIEVVGQCFIALLALAPADYIPFVAEYLNRGGDVRVEAAAALGELPDEAAVVALKNRFAQLGNHLEDRELKRAILLSLGASRLEVARDFLLQTFERGDSDDAKTCVKALQASRFWEEVKDRLTS